MTDRVTPLPSARTQDITSRDLNVELGGPGPRRVGASIYDDWLMQLSGRRGLAVFREMGDNDSDIASLLFSISMVARETDWHVEPASDSPQDQAAKEFLEANIEGLETPWEDVIAQALTALQYGWSFQELIYRRDTTPMWDRFSSRPQFSFLDWILDDKNRPLGFRQEQQKGAQPIPIGKGLYFRTEITKPEGRSALRSAYRSYYMKKRAEEILMISYERNLNGLPKYRVPAAILAAGSGNAQYENLKKVVTRTKIDEQMGLLEPSDPWPDTNLPMYEMSLLSPDGDPHWDQAIAVVRMWSKNILDTVLAQWIGLGRDAPGSRALAEPIQGLYLTAVGSVLDQLEETINRQSVRQLFRVQPTSPEMLPRLVHGDVKKVDIAKLSEALKNVAGAGGVVFDGSEEDPVLLQVLELLGLDRPDELGTVSKNLAAFDKALAAHI